MAYGKIKLDTITWDNSGTDTDITVSTIPTAAQLAVKADINDPTLTGVVTVPTPSASGALVARRALRPKTGPPARPRSPPCCARASADVW